MQSFCHRREHCDAKTSACTISSRFRKPPCDPEQRDFPDSVLTLALLSASSGAEGDPLCAPVFGPSGSAQSREQRAAIRNARSSQAFGWSQIETIDDDLGVSAAGGIARTGFDRMVAEVCLGKVGAVAAREVSRFARNNRGWPQLVEMCRVVDTR